MFHQSFPHASSALVTDVTNWEHRGVDDVNRGRCSMLQLPEYNDPGLNVIILTVCGISLSFGLQCKCTAVHLILEGEKIWSLLCESEACSCHTVFCRWYHESHIYWQKGKWELSARAKSNHTPVNKRIKLVLYYIFQQIPGKDQK